MCPNLCPQLDDQFCRRHGARFIDKFNIFRRSEIEYEQA